MVLDIFDLHSAEVKHDLIKKCKVPGQDYPFLINSGGVFSLYSMKIFEPNIPTNTSLSISSNTTAPKQSTSNQSLNTMCVGDIKKSAKVYVCMELGGSLKIGKQKIQIAAYIPDSGAHSVNNFYEVFSPQEKYF